MPCHHHDVGSIAIGQSPPIHETKIEFGILSSSYVSYFLRKLLTLTINFYLEEKIVILSPIFFEHDYDTITITRVGMHANDLWTGDKKRKWGVINYIQEVAARTNLH